MRRITALTLSLTLGGCGYNTWWNPPFTGGYNPNLPVSDSENMRRALGQEPSVSPLTTQPGDIWPGPLAPAPTLKDLEATGGLTPQPEAPVPGSPLSCGAGHRTRRRIPALAVLLHRKAPNRVPRPRSPPPLCPVTHRHRRRPRTMARLVRSFRPPMGQSSRQEADLGIRQRQRQVADNP